MKKRKRYFSEESTENFWPSFTDLITTIALILFFLVLLAFLKQIISVKTSEAAIDSKNKQIESKQKQIELVNAEIAKKEENLMLLLEEIEKIKAEVKNGQIALQLSQDKIENQKEIIAESNKELGDLRTKLRDVAVIRGNVLKQVKEAIEKELGKKDSDGKQLVSVAENGNIVLNEGILFDSGSSDVKNASKEVLNKLAKSFEAILNDAETRKFIDAIEIQGHADARKGRISNSVLSTNRSTAVVDYLMEANPNLKAKYSEYFAASGYSYYRPRVEGDNEDAWKANRRIEISVIIKDPSIRELIDEYLNDSVGIFNENEQN